MRILQLVMVFFIASSLSSCPLEQRSKAPQMERAIVGTWRQINGPASMQFFKEGTVVITNSGKATSAYFEFENDDTLKIEPKFRSKDSKDDIRVLRISIKEDQLTISDATGTTAFERQKQR